MSQSNPNPPPSLQAAPRQLGLRSFTAQAQRLSAQGTLADFDRLALQTPPEQPINPAQYAVQWQATGEVRTALDGAKVHWLHLQIQGVLPCTCQRCLTLLELPLDLLFSYRFVDTEEQALEEDEASLEDVLAWQDPFDLHALIEDELIMAEPLVAMHEICPVPVKTQVADADFEEAAPENPFAKLAQLKS